MIILKRLLSFDRNTLDASKYTISLINGRSSRKQEWLLDYLLGVTASGLNGSVLALQATNLGVISRRGKT